MTADPASRTDPSHAPAAIAEGPAGSSSLLLLAHGAGQGPDAPFMSAIAAAVAAAGIRVVRFAFPYMALTALDGRKRPPDREPVLREAYRAQIADHRGTAARLVIGGKSMGGRIASLVADDAGVDGLVCLGFPFHPPGRPERYRGGHLAALATPALLCQGERDPFGSRDELPAYPLGPACRLVWIADGEHSFKPRKRSGRTWEQNLESAARATADFIAALD
jgi:hypothetical protein